MVAAISEVSELTEEQLEKAKERVEEILIDFQFLKSLQKHYARRAKNEYKIKTQKLTNGFGAIKSDPIGNFSCNITVSEDLAEKLENILDDAEDDLKENLTEEEHLIIQLKYFKGKTDDAISKRKDILIDNRPGITNKRKQIKKKLAKVRFHYYYYEIISILEKAQSSPKSD